MLMAMDTSLSALVAQRTRLDVIAGNIAMKEARTKDADGNLVPYRRHVAMMATGDPSRGSGAGGVHVASIKEDTSPFEMKWAPNDPAAFTSGPKKGYVALSNVDYQTEMVNAMVALRAYEANITVMDMAKSMASSTLRLLA